jgi:hypothetical protein
VIRGYSNERENIMDTMDDPIFAAIEQHKQACAAVDAAAEETGGIDDACAEECDAFLEGIRDGADDDGGLYRGLEFLKSPYVSGYKRSCMSWAYQVWSDHTDEPSDEYISEPQWLAMMMSTLQRLAVA